MTAKNYINLAPLFGAALLLGAAGCSQTAPPAAPPAPAVTVATVKEKDIVEWEEFTGRTEAIESVEIRPRVSGYIREVRVSNPANWSRKGTSFSSSTTAGIRRTTRACRPRRSGRGWNWPMPNARPTAPPNFWPITPFPPRKARPAFRTIEEAKAALAARRGGARLRQARLRVHPGARAH